jgi:hypothetical protein
MKDRGRELLILTLTTMCRATNSKGIVTGAVAAGLEVVCVAREGGALIAKAISRNGRRVFAIHSSSLNLLEIHSG